MTKTIKDIIIKIPAKIAKIAKEHKLNRTETEALAQVDYLNNGDGCTATNAYLGVYIGKTSKTAQRVIAKLITLGLVTAKYINKFKRILTTTFEKVTEKLVEAVKEVGHFVHKITSKCGDIFTYKKQSKSFNNQEIKGYQKIELKVYQYDHETKEQFEARCNESRDRLDVIVVPVPKLDKKTDNNSLIDNMNKMKNAFNKFKLSCSHV
jgi:hypothetical protein